MSACPVCDASVLLEEDTLKGELKDCDECGAELEVTATNPFALNEAPQEEEDWGQ